MSTTPTFTKCLFTKFFNDFYNDGFPVPEKYEYADAFKVDYSKHINFFVPYLVDKEFVEAEGLKEIGRITQSQHSLLAHDMIECYNRNGKVPVLAHKKKSGYDTKTYRIFSPIEYADKKVEHLNKPDNLLKILYKSIEYSTMFDNFKFMPIKMYECQISTTKELFHLIEYLDSADYIRSNNLREKKGLVIDLDKMTIYPTLNGYKYLNKEISQNSKKVFIAMQFNWEKQTASTPITNKENEFYIKAIKEACTACGYEASIVSSDHTNYITDQIISEIRDSKFIIVDFTFNNRGAYFEAGYARALGKDVIHTVSKNHIKGEKDFEQLHFDIQQINYIDWDDFEKLKMDLIFRIKALGY